MSEVSNNPLQQSLNDLEQVYQNFFKSCKGTRLGRKVRLPKLKKRNAKQSARFRVGGFKLDGDKISLAKIGNFKIIWSRPLPNSPSSITVIKDAANRYFLRFVVDMLNDRQNIVIGGITQHGNILTHDFDIKPFFQTTTPMSALMRLYPPANPVEYPPCV